ncbi:MAG TPA: hypothetical protein PKN78_10915, partial [Tenuifilaceae bacterium]|nr:hypothetical protein [Tenuifilaceae bacterium]
CPAPDGFKNLSDYRRIQDFRTYKPTGGTCPPTGGTCPAQKDLQLNGDGSQNNEAILKNSYSQLYSFALSATSLYDEACGELIHENNAFR